MNRLLVLPFNNGMIKLYTFYLEKTQYIFVRI